MIVYSLDKDGGFTAGDTDTEATAYAYPTSIAATKAKRDPEGLARQMTVQAAYLDQFCQKDIVAQANARNWARLNDDDTAVRRLSKLRFAKAEG